MYELTLDGLSQAVKKLGSHLIVQPTLVPKNRLCESRLHKRNQIKH